MCAGPAAVRLRCRAGRGRVAVPCRGTTSPGSQQCGTGRGRQQGAAPGGRCVATRGMAAVGGVSGVAESPGGASRVAADCLRVVLPRCSLQPATLFVPACKLS